jgi:hypothetical protein
VWRRRLRPRCRRGRSYDEARDGIFVPIQEGYHYIYLSEYPLKYLGIDFQITNSFLSIDWCVHGGYLHCSSGF